MKLKEKNLPNVVTCFLQFNLYRNNENPFMHKKYYLRVCVRERERERERAIPCELGPERSLDAVDKVTN